MSVYVQGLVSPNDDTYLKQSKVLMACIDAGISELPKETAEYFGSNYPDEYLLEEKLEVDVPSKERCDEDSFGFEVMTKDIPEGVEKIRFVVSP